MPDFEPYPSSERSGLPSRGLARYVSPTSIKGSATRDLSVASTTSNITLSGNLLTGQ